jgi:hypothetical protein
LQRALGIALLPLAFSACAPGAWKSDDPYQAFLTQIRDKCWNTQLGRKGIPQLMPGPYTIDDYFMDVTSRFYNGRISETGYVSALEGMYGAKPDSTGVTCILNQMPKNRSVPPPPGTN